MRDEGEYAAVMEDKKAKILQIKVDLDEQNEKLERVYKQVRQIPLVMQLLCICILSQLELL